MSSQREVNGVGSSIRSDIEQLYALYCQLQDDGRADEWSSLFTSDGVFQGPGRPKLSNIEEIRGFGQARDHRGIKHLTFNIATFEDHESEGKDEISSSADFVIVRCDEAGSSGTIVAVGRYTDKLVRTDKGLKFKERIVSRIL